MSSGETYAVVDFEANGFPKHDGVHTACIYFLKTFASRNRILGNYSNRLNAIFLELDGSFSAIQWGSIEDTEQFESNFSLIWETHRKNGNWKQDLVKKALEFYNSDFQWRVLTISTGTRTFKHHLCYQESDYSIMRALAHENQCGKN